MYRQILLMMVAFAATTHSSPVSADSGSNTWKDGGGTFSASGLNKIDAHVSVGSISVVATNRRDVEITSTRDGRHASRTTIELWKSKARVEIRRKGDRLVLVDKTPKGNNGECPNLIVKIQIPKDLSLKASAEVGTLDGTGQFSDVDLNTQVGATRFQGQCTGSRFSANSQTGALDVQLTHSLPRQIDLRTEVGAATLAIPGNSNAKVHAHCEIGKVRFGRAFVISGDWNRGLGAAFGGTINEGGHCNIQVTTNVGAISVESSEPSR